MKFLIKNIIKRNEIYQEKTDDIDENCILERKVILDSENHNKPEIKTRKRNDKRCL